MARKKKDDGGVGMEPKRFWDLIACGKKPATDAHHKALVRELAKLSQDDIAAFDNRLWYYMGVANRWGLWGAAYLINGGCSDDGFCYFRCWLIAQGKEAFDKALADPDSLVEITEEDEDYHEFEDLLGVARAAWDKAGKGKWEDLHAYAEKAGRNKYPDTQGKSWDFDDDAQMRKRYPRLMARIDES